MSATSSVDTLRSVAAYSPGRSPDPLAAFAPGTIYVVRDEHSRAIKIGFTSRTVKRRLKEFRTGNPGTPTVLWNGPGSLVDENRIHRLLQPCRIRGEWFHDSDVVRIAIALMRWYGAEFVAGLELNMLETFVVTVPGVVPHFFKVRKDWGPDGYMPKWSSGPC